jgi:ketosteroid isomerase-like protein
MKTAAVLTTAALTLSLAAVPAPATPLPSAAELQAALDRMVQTERDFAKTAVDKGTREAFLTFLAEEAVLFRPGPVPGRQFIESSPATATYLAWRPIHAEISASGDLGFNTGPYELRPAVDSSQKSWGHFVTIWKRQVDGGWKAVLDTGIDTPRPYSGPEGPFTLPTPAPKSPTPPMPPIPADPAALRTALLGADRTFSQLSRARGAVLAYLSTFDNSVGRLLTSGAQPAVGREAIRAALGKKSKQLRTWEPEAGEVSQAGDFGYTYGTLETRESPDGPAARAAYTRIWRRQAGRPWKVVLEVASPLPPAPPAALAPPTVPAPPPPPQAAEPPA